MTLMSPPRPPLGASFAKRRFNRRGHDRYPAGGYPCILGWWEGAEFRTTPLALRDIGRGGAAAFTEAPPPADVPACLFPQGRTSSRWFAARVVRVADADDGR